METDGLQALRFVIPDRAAGWHLPGVCGHHPELHAGIRAAATRQGRNLAVTEKIAWVARSPKHDHVTEGTGRLLD